MGTRFSRRLEPQPAAARASARRGLGGDPAAPRGVGELPVPHPAQRAKHLLRLLRDVRDREKGALGDFGFRGGGGGGRISGEKGEAEVTRQWQGRNDEGTGHRFWLRVSRFGDPLAGDHATFGPMACTGP